jgi:hypothetical protein
MGKLPNIPFCRRKCVSEVIDRLRENIILVRKGYGSVAIVCVLVLHIIVKSASFQDALDTLGVEETLNGLNQQVVLRDPPPLTP